MLTDKGLCRIDSGVDAMCRYTEPKNVKLFGDLKVTNCSVLSVFSPLLFCLLLFSHLLFSPLLFCPLLFCLLLFCPLLSCYCGISAA